VSRVGRVPDRPQRSDFTLTARRRERYASLRQIKTRCLTWSDRKCEIISVLGVDREISPKTGRFAAGSLAAKCARKTPRIYLQNVTSRTHRMSSRIFPNERETRDKEWGGLECGTGEGVGESGFMKERRCVARSQRSCEGKISTSTYSNQ
jgi:hypothetical protein